MPKQKRNKTKYPGVYFIESAQGSSGRLERVYYIMYRRNGKLIEEKAGRQKRDDMTPAKAAKLRALRIDGDQSSNKEQRVEKQGQWTIEMLWKEYRNQRKDLKGLLPDKSRYKCYLKSAVGSKAPADLVTLDIDRIRIRLLKSKSPQTVKLVLALLKRIINFGVKKGLCPIPDPSRLHIEMPKVDNVRTEDLDADQLKALMKAIDADSNRQVANMMKLALFTGMRRGELFRLKWDHVNFKRNFIYIENPKGGKSQSIPLNGVAKSLLESHERLNSPYVFPGQSGNQRTDARGPVCRIKKRAKLPADFRPLHGLRHVYASMLASSGEVDMYTLQKLLTHKSPQMTQRYAHLRDEALQKASNVAGDMFHDIAKEEDEQNKVIQIRSSQE
ncbi:tyrosine-type recombinase/integrase [Pseudodesulfovibrio sp.]|uniref:tyrosine-type recombinase/integrase n=1 Tax=unclassified Pseudodesulfovibrio TaxID=2661612 RepID=UPI003AFF7B44